jgi:uncharacterized membrane protein YozB (DUF420 family)
MDISVFPPLNAALNGLATVLLTGGFVAIRRQQVRTHRTCMLSAFGVSAVFLVSYLTHKILLQAAHTPFGGEGFWAWAYYAMLISHILLAMAILPLVIVTMTLALRGRFDKHRRWARVTYPIWYYVSITGVLIYFFLYQWFPADVAASPV